MRTFGMLCLLFGFLIPQSVVAQKTHSKVSSPKGKKKQKKKRKTKVRMQDRVSGSTTCSDQQIFFDKKCRSKSWVGKNLYNRLDESERNEAGAFVWGPNDGKTKAPTRVTDGNTIYELTGKKVPAAARGKRSNPSKGARKKGKKGRKMTAMSTIVPKAFRRGDYLVKRRMRVLKPVAGNSTDYRIHVEDVERTPNGRYRWKTVQMHTSTR